MERNDKRTENILKGVVIGLLCLVLLVGGILCLTWGLNVPEQGNVQAQETSAPPPETFEEPAVEPTVPAADVPAEEPEVLETEASTTPAQKDDTASDKKDPVYQWPEEEKPAETKPSKPEVTEPSVPVETEPTQPEATEPPVEETVPDVTEPPVEENKALQASGQVNAENNVVMEDTSFSDNGVSAQVPAGVLLEENTTELVLTITEKDSSDSGVTLEDGQAMRPLDVHMEGVSQNNTQPIQVCLGKVLPNGMNIGNVTLYHVENGTANPMTQVLTMTDLDTHNEFYYDPATGDTTVAMASFSEVAVVSDTEKKWEGIIATAFSSGTGTEEDPYIIANADQLAYMSQAVSNDEAYAEAHYKLISDINLNGDVVQAQDKKEWVFYPIGYWAKQVDETGTALKNSAGEEYYGAGNSFSGVFDGNGNTISNIYQNTWLMDGNYDAGYWNTAMGLFGALYNATIKNLTIDNFQSDGEFTPTGCIAAYAGGPEMLFENIYLTNCNPRVYNTGNGGLVGLNYNSSSEGSYDHITFKNITVDQTNKISALWGSYDVSCGGILGRLRENSKHDGTNTDGQKNTVTFDNCHVAAIMDVNNDCCANYQYYQYRYSGMFIGTVDYIGDVPNVGVEDVVFANECTFTYGDWNEYWYCELVKNTLASYTHDHQFSRLTKISAVSEIQDENGNWNTEGSFVLPNEDNTAAECYHIFKDSEGNLYQHFHNKADESNPTIYETKDIDGDGELNDLKEDRTCYFIPFGQLWTGYGWGSSPAYNADAYENIGITLREDGLVKSESKFTSKDVTTVTQDVPVSLSELVALSVDESKLSKSTLEVFVSPVITDTTTSNVTADISIDTSKWGDSKLTFSGTGPAKIVITDYFYCTPTEIYITVSEPADVDKFDLVFENTDKYLYRVGNANTVALGSLFKAKDGAEIGNVTATVTSLDENISVSGTYTANTTDWTKGTIQFSGTGPVLVTIDDDDYANEKTLMLEVVDATNVTDYSGLGNRNSVLLNDITMTSDSSYYLSGATLYGNGFIFDVTDGAYSGTGSISNNYVVCLSNAALDNVEIKGAVYTAYGAQVANDYNRPTVLSVGNNTITNCYISNCAAPVRVNGGNLEIINSTLKGGNFANLDIRNGHVVLDNVTTINQVNGNDTAEDGNVVVGLGVVVYYENVLNTTTVEVKNGITQYNHLSKTQANTYITDTTAKQLTAKMFESAYSAVQYNDGSDTWVNTGILSMAEAVGDANISDIDGYVEASPSMTGVTGYLHTKQPDATSIATTAPAYTTAGQGAIAPSYSFDYTTKNYVEKTDGSNDYCYEENGTVYISMDAGDTSNWDTSILTATKNGQTLDYTVSMNGTDYTGQSIPFSVTGAYEVVYTYTDSNNYSVDEEGNITTYSKSYAKTVHINVAVIEASAKNAEFTMGSSNAATEKITVDNVTYISATDVTADNSTWTYMTIGDQKIYYPIVAAKLTSTKGTSSYAYFPVFENVVTITDYADRGTGDAFTYNSSTTTLPSTLTAVKGVYKAASEVTNWYSLTNSSLTQSGASKIFKWASSSDAPSDPETYNNVLCYKSPEVTADRATYITLVQYSYTDATNTTYYYYVGYTLEAFTKECVAGDTLITLADGTQVRVDALTGEEELLVWNLETGSYDTAPIVFIDSDAETEYEVVNLYFSDGSEVGVIYEHGFFDLALGEYVYLDASNAESYIGHSFVTQGDIAGNTWQTATLTDVVIEKKVTTAYSPVSFSHLCYYTDGVLSMPGGIEGLFNIFEVDTSIMAYDAEKKAQDIETYGLYTYEDFADMIPEEAFHAFNGAYLKVAIGKGMLTWEEIEELAERYVPLM